MSREPLTVRIWVTKSTLRRLNVLKAQLGMKSLDELLQWLVGRVKQ